MEHIFNNIDIDLKALIDINDSNLPPVTRFKRAKIFCEKLIKEEQYELVAEYLNTLNKNIDIGFEGKIEIAYLQALLYLNLGKFADSETILFDILNKIGKLQNVEMRIKVNEALSELYLKIGEFEQAKSYLKTTIKDSIAIKDNENVFRYLNRYTSIVIEMGEVDEGLKIRKISDKLVTIF
jgi:tetratricopeptide (TPR) repeat protein